MYECMYMQAAKQRFYLASACENSRFSALLAACLISRLPSEVLTTHKVWGKILFEHFQFCSILSDIPS